MSTLKFIAFTLCLFVLIMIFDPVLFFFVTPLLKIATDLTGLGWISLILFRVFTLVSIFCVCYIGGLLLGGNYKVGCLAAGSYILYDCLSFIYFMFSTLSIFVIIW